MSLQNAKLPKLIDKLEEKAALEAELAGVDDKIDEIVGEKKSKIKRVSLKGSKNPKKG